MTDEKNTAESWTRESLIIKSGDEVIALIMEDVFPLQPDEPMFYTSDVKLAESRANLIAVAPKMLSLLETVFEAFKGGTYDDNHTAQIESLISEARNGTPETQSDDKFVEEQTDRAKENAA